MFAPHDSRIELAASEPSDQRPPPHFPQNELGECGIKRSETDAPDQKRPAHSSQRDDLDLSRSPPGPFLRALLRALGAWQS